MAGMEDDKDTYPFVIVIGEICVTVMVVKTFLLNW